MNHSGFRRAKIRYTSKQREIKPEITYRIFISRSHQALTDEYQPPSYQKNNKTMARKVRPFISIPTAIVAA